jgi:hypothetical protein
MNSQYVTSDLTEKGERVKFELIGDRAAIWIKPIAKSVISSKWYGKRYANYTFMGFVDIKHTYSLLHFFELSIQYIN